MKKIVFSVFAWFSMCSVTIPVGQANADSGTSTAPYWREEMARVHNRFKGHTGTFAHFGDSITVTQAFWSPLLYERKNAPDAMERAFEQVRGYLKPECWRDWKGGRFGSEGRKTIRWAHENVDGWLERLNPEVVLIMFGTNDLNSVPIEEYKSKTRAVVQTCLDNGTVIILSTIPPRHGFVEKSAQYAEAVRDIARQMRVPLVDFHSEILKRRPNDWDGAADKFSQYVGYDVPTLLARDGVHPSHPKLYRNDYSAEALARCGFSLRNYLVLVKYAEVIRALGLVPGTGGNGQDEGIPERQDWWLDPPTQDWLAQAPPLPPATGQTLEVSGVRELVEALRRAKPGQTILVADGHYMMPHYVQISADNVTLRGASGHRERVVIDGAKSRDGELLGVSSSSGVTIADLSIQNIKWNGFKINSQTNVQRLTIYNCIVHNIWQRGVKGVRVPEANRELIRPKSCRIQYCLFYNDRPKRLDDDGVDIVQGNYIAGIDVMFATDWVISDNVFVGIQGRTYEGRGAVFVWHDSQRCVIERNVIIDCDVGLQLGNPHKPPDIEHHCVDFIARNNFITRAPEAGIVTVYTRDCKILNNTIHDPESRMRRLVRTVFANEGLLFANNLLSGPGIRNESGSEVAFAKNLVRDFSDMFVDPRAGDLHLKNFSPEIADKGIAYAEVVDDFDGQARGPDPDIGADELAE